VTMLSPSQPNAPDRDITIDFAIAVERLRQLGITVHHSTAITTSDVAVWFEDTQTICLRADATFWAKLFILADLHAMYTKPGHISPSTPIPRLTLVSSRFDEPDRDGVGVESRPSSLPRETWTDHHRRHRPQHLTLQRQPHRVPHQGRVVDPA
jgi:hypothetical protein